MSRRVIFLSAMLIGTAASIVGLGGGCDSPRAIKEAKPVGGDEPAESTTLVPEPAPEKTDPAASAVVAAAVAAHTSSHPDRLGAFRTVTFTRKGHVVGAGGGQLKQTWTVHAAWPDRFRVRAEFENPLTLTVAWGPSGGWQHATGQRKVTLPPQGVRDYKIDVTSDWIGLLFPFAEPGTLFAPAPDQTVDGKPAVGIRMWHPELAFSRVYFDKTSKQLVNYIYEGREDGRKVTKEITVLSTREFAGVILPERTVVRSNGNVIAEWTLTTLEPKSQLDPKLFEDP